MQKIDTSTAVAVRPAPGPLGAPGWFTGGDPAAGELPTVVDADWFNAVQAELLGALAAAGVAPDKAASDQLARAMATMAGVYGAAVGANVLTLEPAFAPPAYSGGLRVFAKIAAANTGAVTINVAGLGPKALKTPDGAALIGGELRAGMVAQLIFDGAGFILVNSPTAPTPGAGDSSRRLATTEFVGQATAAVAADARAFRYLSATTVFELGPNAVYLVNTAAGPISAPLPAMPATGDLLTFIDAQATWSANNFTLARNGKTIMAAADDLRCDVSNSEFSIRWSGDDWRLV